MSYPLLHLTSDRAHVEVRKGRGAQGWASMTEVFSGAAQAGKEWKAGEGEKLAGRCCMWPDDPTSTLSLPYVVASTQGLGVGKAERLNFPDDQGWSASLDKDRMPAMTAPFILHEDPFSANCYKIRLTAALVGQPIERRGYDITRGETRTEAFLSGVNANGRVPVLQMGDLFLPESNAACWYLGQGTPLVPADRYDQADVLRWMFFEQYNHEPNVATLRFWLGKLGEETLSEVQRAQIPGKRAAGEAALRLMDEHLAGHDWFVGKGITLADIALYAYTHVCEPGGFILADYPHIQAWIARVEQEPAYIPMG